MFEKLDEKFKRAWENRMLRAFHGTTKLNIMNL